jgi:hypothetical protein
MGEIANSINKAFRDTSVPGISASGKHEPVKSEIRDIGPVIETALATIGNNMKRFNTKAARNASSGNTAGQIAYIYANNNDPADPANGYYQHNGGTAGTDADWQEATWLNSTDARIDALDIASSKLNIWPDPLFENVRSAGVVLGGFSTMLHRAGSYVTGDADPLAKNPMSRGGWKCSGGLLSFFVRFNLPGTDELHISPGDKISVGALMNAASGANLILYYKFLKIDNTDASSQNQTGPVVSNGAPQVLQANNLTVPADAASLLIYVDDAGLDPYLLALWAVVGTEAGFYPPNRVAMFDEQTASAAKVTNLWADPYFRHVRSSGDMIGNDLVVLAGYDNGVYVSADQDAAAANALSGGAWKMPAGGALHGFWLRFDNPSIAAFGLSAGDVLSVGAIGKSAAIGGARFGLYGRFFDNSGTLIGTQFGGANSGTGSFYPAQINNLTVPADAAGLFIYMDAGNPSPSYCSALWIVPSASTGTEPPEALLTAPLANDLGGGGSGNLNPDPNSLALAPRIFALAGLEANIYPANLRSGRGERLFDFNITGNKGLQLNERWTWTPGGGDAGDYALTLNACDPETLISISSASATLSVVAQGSAAGKAVKLLTIGDSNTASGWRLKRMKSLSTSRLTDVQISFLGTQTTTISGVTVNHEGRGGWSVPRYYAPTGGDVALNPFCPGVGQKFNAQHYLTTSGIAVPDVVAWPLGVNEMFSHTGDAALNAAIASNITMLKEMIGITASGSVGSWWEVDPDIVHLIPLPLLPLDQDGFAPVVGSGQSQARYWRNIVGYSLALIEEFGGMEGDGVFLIPHNASHDVLHNMPKAAVAPWNVHSTLTVARDSNDVHPADAGGNEQLADCEFAALCWLAANGHI